MCVCMGVGVGFVVVGVGVGVGVVVGVAIGENLLSSPKLSASEYSTGGSQDDSPVTELR